MKTILEMAIEAGIDAEKDTLCRNEGWIEPLTRFAELVRADEREACAYRAGIALLGADRGLANRVDQAIRSWRNT